jgi:hypothetical protein
MPWKEVSIMSQRLEFVQMASSGKPTSVNSAGTSVSLHQPPTNGSIVFSNLSSHRVCWIDHDVRTIHPSAQRARLRD